METPVEHERKPLAEITMLEFLLKWSRAKEDLIMFEQCRLNSALQMGIDQGSLRTLKFDLYAT